ncbi:MAG: ATP-dependent helicase [Lachnospiraceae bacterium]|nr:ATP-dependent helicase [Lachnospiraceae bacterium]
MAFSEAQERAIAHKDGPAMVLAGPGSGKTLVITQRTKYLIDTYQINPREILVITFTKAAAQEMQGRFQAIGGRSGVTFGTFHAVFFGILKHAYHYTAANVMSEDTRIKMIREIYTQRCAPSACAAGSSSDPSARTAGSVLSAASGGSGSQGGAHSGAAESANTETEADTISGIAAEISAVKNEHISLEHYYARSCSEDVFRDVYRCYEEMHRQQRLLDFDDMLTYTWELLTQRKDILHAWQERWHYILVDEFQDINLLQYEILRLLAAPRNNLFIVGDDDQSIYRFRGAKPEIMLNFPKDYPQAETILLDQNFRSTGKVVSGSLKVIEENNHRFSKKIRYVRPEGTPIDIREFQDPDHESLYLVQLIRKRAEEEHVPYQDMAILVRTNQGAGPIAERLTEFNIPFLMRETLPSVYEHWIAKDLFAYLHLAYEGLERNAFLRVMNHPKRYISREAVAAATVRAPQAASPSRMAAHSWQAEPSSLYAAGSLENMDAQKTVSFAMLYEFYREKEWMEEYLVNFEADLKLLPNLKPYAAVNYIRYGMQYEKYLQEYAALRRMKAEELIEILDEIQQGAKPYESVSEWYAHIEDYKAALEENRRKARKSGAEAITIATLHASKGLEFPEVFLPDVNEGILPHHRASLDADFEEERRLFYVGMTRAKDRLHIFYTKERYGKKQEPSGFLDVFLTDGEEV